MAMVPGTKTTHDKFIDPTNAGTYVEPAKAPDNLANLPAGFVEAISKKDAGKLFRVRLLKGYFPAGHYVVIRNGQPVAVTSPPSSAMTITDKLEADSVVELPIEEARACVAKGIAERADGIGF